VADLADGRACADAAAHLHFARTGSDRLIAELRDGVFARIAGLAREQTDPIWDLRFSGTPGKPETLARLYYSGYGALTIKERHGAFRFAKPERHAIACRFDPEWAAAWRSAEEWSACSDDVMAFLERSRKHASDGHIQGIEVEGRVQGALCAHFHRDLCVVDRESQFHIPHAMRKLVVDDASSPSLAAREALVTARTWKPELRASIGGELDALAIDSRGRLLVIEVKPFGFGAASGPLQALTYARIVAAWTHALGWPQARAILAAMAEQRVLLGLSHRQQLADNFEIVPVVAMGAPRTAADARAHAEIADRIREVVHALRKADGTVGNIETWWVDAAGAPSVVAP
jgi:hypothetical protein